MFKPLIMIWVHLLLLKPKKIVDMLLKRNQIWYLPVVKICVHQNMSAMQEENTINWDFVVSIRRKPKNIHPSNLFHFLINIKRED